MSPKLKGVRQGIPRIYQRAAEDLIMYGYVLGMQRGLPSVTTQGCVEMFMKDFDLMEEDYSRDCGCVTFRRMREEHKVL